MVFVPREQADSSQARSAWDSATTKRPSRRGTCDAISQVQERSIRREIPGISSPDHTVPYGTALSRGAFQALRTSYDRIVLSGTHARCREPVIRPLRDEETF